MTAPVILYVEVPGFYAEAERARHPDVDPRKPLIVGGDPRKRGLVQSASLDARAAGVTEGMLMLEALQRCPRASTFRTEMKHYRELSAELVGLLARALDAVEPAGLGAAFLDASRTPRDPEGLARQLREQVAAELSLPLRAGIAPVKFLARLAAEDSGEDGVRRVLPGQEGAFLAPVELSRLPGVGPRTLSRLAELGARNVAELLLVRRERLERAVGNHGLRILEFAQGRDPTPVRISRQPRSLSQETRFEQAGPDPEELRAALLRLAQGLEEGLHRRRLAARRVALKLRTDDGSRHSRSCTLERPTAEAALLAEAALQLRERVELGRARIHSLGIHLAGLVRPPAEDRQLDLFSPASPTASGAGTQSDASPQERDLRGR